MKKKSYVKKLNQFTLSNKDSKNSQFDSFICNIDEWMALSLLEKNKKKLS